ncbi:MAG: cysteine--tRNA ligase [Kiritimatiellae bacterium]|jgi:cysteinyl-tRNA synthetase|nr:cysteine--tRNA ligase [Kiritimatiellia bacterium]
MEFYNTFSRELETFRPIEDSQVKMYTCGPTVYNYAHIGNFRAYMFEDILRRSLEYLGYDVIQVMNLTDVDDKTINGSIATGVSLDDYTSTYKKAFFEDLESLGIEPAEYYPAATGHIPEMIHLIETLIERGNAYVSDDNCVYFKVTSFSDYGKLAHLNMDGMQAGARVAQDEYDKDNVADFALWKAWDESDGDVWWDSPWGKGRPGWHIECSAMSFKYLGESFDIHTGGIDNMFPHHENEIAQAEAATGKKFVNYWLHCAHLRVDNQKMSKSVGNFYTLRDLFDKGYEGREIRYVLLAGHYRQSLNFSFDALDAAKTSLGRIDAFRLRLKEYSAAGDEKGTLPMWAEKASVGFHDGISDDLNVSECLAEIFDMIHDGNIAMDAGELTAADGKKVDELFDGFNKVLGVLDLPEQTIPAGIEALVVQRKEARDSKNWALSDEIRDQLARMGWEVKDTPDGAKLRKA